MIGLLGGLKYPVQAKSRRYCRLYIKISTSISGFEIVESMVGIEVHYAGGRVDDHSPVA